MDSNPTQLYDRLKNSQLEHYFARFTACGIVHLQGLSELTMQEYEVYGVQSAEDRAKLFKLIQNIRIDLAKNKSHANAPQRAAPPTPISLSNLMASARPSVAATEPIFAPLSVPAPALPISSIVSAPALPPASGPFPVSLLPRLSPKMQPVHAGHAAAASKASPSTRDSRIPMPPLIPPAPATLSVSSQLPAPTVLRRLAPPQTPAARLLKSPTSTVDKMVIKSASHLPAILAAQTPSHPQASAKSLSLSFSGSRSSSRSRSQVSLYSGLSSEKGQPLSSTAVPPVRAKTGLSVYGVPQKFNAKASVSSRASLSGDRIRVCVRKRPLSTKESAKNEQDIVQLQSSKRISIFEPRLRLNMTKYTEEHEFIFDEIFDENTTNEEVYVKTIRPLIDTIFQLGKATCFVYGQTGSGKTFTMLHPDSGLYILAAQDILAILNAPSSPSRFKLSASISFYEIYQGQLYDLFNGKQRVHARENKHQHVCIVGLAEVPFDSLESFRAQVEVGCQERRTGVTGANSDSSRSHAILEISIKNHHQQLVGKLSFIDLAGSERGADREEVDRQTKLEGSEINKSLLALKECIRAMDQDSSHLPFRQSKLTQVLKDSFVGHAKTCMIATIAPNQGSCEHTLNTLRYAYRVKELKKESRAEGCFNEEESVFHRGLLTADAADKSAFKEESGLLEELDAGCAAGEEPSSFIENENLLVEEEENVHPSFSKLASPIATPKKSTLSFNIAGTPTRATKKMPKVDAWKLKIAQALGDFSLAVQKSQSEDHLELLCTELTNLYQTFDVAVSNE